MFDTSIDNLQREYEHSRERCKDHIEGLEQMIARTVGPAYDNRMGTGLLDPENHNFEYLSGMLPMVAFRAPTMNVKSRRLEPEIEDEAYALKHYGKRWQAVTDFEELTVELATDYLYSASATVTQFEAVPGMHEHEDPLMMAQIVRLAPGDFGWDPLAKGWKKCRFSWHRYPRDVEDLQRLAQKYPDDWNKEAIDLLVAGAGIDDYHEESNADGIDRREVMVVEFYIAEEQLEGEPGPDEGYNGSIHTFAVGFDDHGSQHAHELRKPRMYFGPRGGPYDFGGAFLVPSRVQPLGPMTAVEGQVRELNDFMRSMSESAKRAKNIIAFDEANAEAAEAMNEAGHDFWVAVPNMGEVKPQQMAIGGVNATQMAWKEVTKQVLREVAGLSSSSSGQPNSDVTATAEAVAASAAENRSHWVADRFRKFISGPLEKVLWYAYHSDAVVEPIGAIADPETGERSQVMFVGGDATRDRIEELRGQFPGFLFGDARPGSDPRFMEGSGSSWDDLEFEIDVFSMGRQTEAARRSEAQELTALGSTLAAIAGPAFRADKYLEMYAELKSRPAYNELIDPELYAQLTQSQPDEPGPEERQPQSRHLPRFRPVAPSGVNVAAALGSPGRMPGAAAGSMAGASAQEALQPTAGGF